MPSAKDLRAVIIERFRLTLKEVKPSGAPKWAVVLAVTPVFLWEVARHMVFCLWHTLKFMGRAVRDLVLAPFLGVFLFCDVTVVTFWFFKNVVEKMSGEK